MTPSDETQRLEREDEKLPRRARASAGRGARARVRRLGGRRIIAEGLERNFWTDFYFNAMTVPGRRSSARSRRRSWRSTSPSRSSTTLGDAPVANARQGLADLFFFSVETTSTVGYGDMHPQTIYGHIVATVGELRRRGVARDDDRPGVRAHLAAPRAA